MIHTIPPSKSPSSHAVTRPPSGVNASRKYFESLLEKAGLEPREAQLSMMEAVEKALDKNQISVMEGGTGVGKSFGYLIPVLNDLALEEGVRIVVATATVTLQEQLFLKDVKKVLSILGQENISAEIAKGRGRYVCPQRLYAYNTGAQAEMAYYGVTETPKKNNTEDQEKVHALQEQLSLGSWSGDRDELKESVPSQLWGSLTADSATCTNRRCSYFSECPYFKIKKNLSKAKLLITNHDLLLSDIALGSGVLLPEFSNTVYIIDEAHHFAQKALNQFESETEILGAKLWLRSLEGALSKWAQAVQWNEGHEKAVLSEIETLKNLLDNCHTELENIWQEAAETGHGIGYGISQGMGQNNEFLFETVPNSLRECLVKLRESSSKLASYLSALHEKFLETQETTSFSSSDFEKSLAMLAVLNKKNYGFLRTMDLLLLPDSEPIAKWVTLNQNQPSKKRDLIVHAAWVTASELLKHYFWSRVKRGVILCSATLKALGSFDNFLNKVGLLGDKRVQTHAFLSPFEYEKSQLNIPWMQHVPEGSESQAHTAEVIQKIPALLKNNAGGVLVLFSSQWLLQAVFDGLDKELQAIVLCQGKEGRSLLLNKHKNLIDEKKPSVIFGLQSFSEGVDLPGDYCTHVIIPKLPFASPTTPTERAYQRWLKNQNRNAFLEHSLPEASLKLTQAVGRLIRRMGDQGEITILDYRIIRKFYGKNMINSLPKFTKNIELQQK